MFYKKVVAKFTGKYLYQILFINEVDGWRLVTLSKKLLPRCFPVNFAKILKTPFTQITYERLLLINVSEKISFLGVWYFVSTNKDTNWLLKIVITFVMILIDH